MPDPQMTAHLSKLAQLEIELASRPQNNDAFITENLRAYTSSAIPESNSQFFLKSFLEPLFCLLHIPSLANGDSLKFREFESKIYETISKENKELDYTFSAEIFNKIIREKNIVEFLKREKITVTPTQIADKILENFSNVKFTGKENVSPRKSMKL